MKLPILQKALKLNSAHYAGKVCLKHALLKGKRSTANRTCVGCANDKSKRARLKLKDLIFAHYGLSCTICGISDADVLTIDHISQDGALRRKEMGIREGTGMYRWIKKHGYPSGFRVLCYNCNIKAFRVFQRNKKE